MTAAAAGVLSTPRRTALFAGNLLIGMAVGLLGYYALTGLFTVREQAVLDAELPVAGTQTLAPAGTEPLDFTGWEAEDAAYWEGLGEGEAFGRLVSEPMGLDAVVVKGTSRADLRKGPGWIASTDLPGPEGNCGIAGHRTTYLAPFRSLDKLQRGDTIEFYSPYRRYTYRVVRVFAVEPDQVEVIASTPEPMLTLSACHPPYSARQRLIAQSELVEVRRLSP